MNENQYQAQQLITLLEDLQNQRASGTLYLEAEINPNSKKRFRVLVLKNGQITYGGSNIPKSQDFARILGQKFKRGKWIDTAINLAMQRTETQTSTQSFLELLVKMRQFSWEQVETLIHTQVVLTLEQVLPYAGRFEFSTKTVFDLCYGDVCRGLDWSQLMLDITRRQEEWSTLFPLIPSMEAVPHLQANALQKITDPAVLQQLQESVDGKRSLCDIAISLDQDPLHVAQSYLVWVQAGWVVFEGSTHTENLPTILAVDDSLVMQTIIKQTLAERYQVLVASNAKDALTLLNHNKVRLLLLDVSMPEIDGLELCRTVRSLYQFRNLPIIMLSTRDGHVDKIKGQIAGSTQYLTKPFDPENLRAVVGKYVSSGTASLTGSTSS